MGSPVVPAYHDYFFPHDQGYGSGVVAGAIAVMVLDVNPILKWNKVHQKLMEGADKVGGYAYTFPGGRSHQMGAGRVNCDKSVAIAIVGREEENLMGQVLITNDPSNLLTVTLPLGMRQGAMTLHLLDATGRMTWAWEWQATGEQTRLQLPPLAQGIYLVQMETAQGTVAQKVYIYP